MTPQPTSDAGAPTFELERLVPCDPHGLAARGEAVMLETAYKNPRTGTLVKGSSATAADHDPLTIGGTLMSGEEETMRAIRLGLMVGLIVAIGTACASTESAPPRSTYNTLMAGWEHRFTIEWAAAEQSPNARRVSGYVQSQYGEYATSLRILAQAIDSTGAVVGQRVVYVPGGVGGFGRAYFEVPNLPATPNYRVSVWDYEWLQAPKTR